MQNDVTNNIFRVYVNGDSTKLNPASALSGWSTVSNVVLSISMSEGYNMFSNVKVSIGAVYGIATYITPSLPLSKNNSTQFLVSGNTTNDTITTYISVTDTLIINTTITGLTPPNNVTSIKVFPNPANDHITINYGNYAAIIGYTLKITNALGQIVFTTPINQQTSYVDLSTWSGNGIYFLQIFDLQNNMVENRKIVLQ